MFTSAPANCTAQEFIDYYLKMPKFEKNLEGLRRDLWEKGGVFYEELLKLMEENATETAGQKIIREETEKVSKFKQEREKFKKRNSRSY